MYIFSVSFDLSFKFFSHLPSDTFAVLFCQLPDFTKLCSFLLLKIFNICLKVCFYGFSSAFLFGFINLMNFLSQFRAILFDLFSTHQFFSAHIIMSLCFCNFSSIIFFNVFNFDFHFIIKMGLEYVELSYRLNFVVVNDFPVSFGDFRHFVQYLIFSNIPFEDFHHFLLSIFRFKVLQIITVSNIFTCLTSTSHC